MAEIGPKTDMEELVESFDVAEQDCFRSALVSILIESTDFDIDTIYALVFCGGRKIIWS